MPSPVSSDDVFEFHAAASADQADAAAARGVAQRVGEQIVEQAFDAADLEFGAFRQVAGGLELALALFIHTAFQAPILPRAP